MVRDRGGVEHIIDGSDLYSLIVLPHGDHWEWLVTHVNTSPGQPSYFARWLSPPAEAPTIADAWKAAEEFLETHRNAPSR